MSDPGDRIDGLYRLPLAEFTAARNQLAGELDDPAAAAEVRKLAKPNLVAWAVNQVYHHARDRFDALVIAAGEVLAAQAAGDADRLREAMRTRRALLDDAVEVARDVLERAGHGTSPAVVQKVTRCLDALATWGDGDGAPPAGRIAREVAPPALEVLARRADFARPPPRPRPAASADTAAASADTAAPAAAPAVAPPPPIDAAARAAFADAEATFEVRTREADRAREGRDRAVARAAELSAKVDEAAERLAELEGRLAAAQREARDAKAAARRADAAERRARDRLDAARARLG